MSRKMKALVCVAHPDDETIFFGGVIQAKKYDWTAVCVTDANADGFGQERYKQFQKACRKLGIQKTIFLNYPDLFDQRLDAKKLSADLKKLGTFDVVYTHGVLGEYGHIHHQDVCFAVFQTFAKTSKIYSPAYNIFPQIKVPLSQKAYNLKTAILSDIYAGESMRFLGLLPATSFEGFVQLENSEVEEIYLHILKKKKLNKKKLKTYAWLADYIARHDYQLKLRPF